MFRRQVPRRALLGFAARGYGDSRQTQSAEPDQLPLAARAAELELIWNSEPELEWELPGAIVTHGDQRELLGWVATYAPQLRPLTGYCRVLSRDVDAFRWNQKPTLGGIADACVGAVLAESTVAGSAGVAPYAVQSFAGSLSFAMARSLALYRDVVPGNVFQRWSEAQTVAKQPLRVSTEGAMAVWCVLERLLREERGERFESGQRVERVECIDVALRVCRDLRFKGEVDPLNWGTLGGGNPLLRSLEQVSAGPVEHRVTEFERVVAAVEGSSVARGMGQLVVGLSASRLKPGSLEHLNVLMPVWQRMPEAALWYGACAGLVAGSTVASFGGGIGRRILRDILTPGELLGPPRSDIDLTELQVLMGGDNPLAAFHVSVPGVVSVELLPGVATLLTWPAGAVARRGAAQSEGPYEDPVKGLGDALTRALNYYRELTTGGSVQRRGRFEPNQPKRRK